MSLAAPIAILGVAALFSLEIVKERFSFARDACDSINRDSAVYRNSPRLQELCDRADTINPESTCLVGCDVDTLCRNPSISYCRKPRSSQLLCDISPEFYGSHPENRDLPRVYRVRRGTCLAVSSESEVIDNAAFRRAVMRFPQSIAVVGSGLKHESRFRGSWSISLTGHRRHDGEHPLPLIEYDYLVQSTLLARAQGVSASVPSAVLHECCVSPGGHDTSFATEPGPFQQRLERSHSHENQPPTLHLTAMFTLPETTSASFGGLKYDAYVQGLERKLSPVSGKRISVRTSVWLMVEVSTKDRTVTEVREVLDGSDGTVHVSRVRTGAALRQLGDGPFVSYSGQAPRLWLGMRDASEDMARG